MPATTVKLEASLLEQIRLAKPREQTLAAYVREAVERDLRRRKLSAAGQEYRAFLIAHPEEQGDLGEWAEARLAVAPRPRRK